MTPQEALQKISKYLSKQNMVLIDQKFTEELHTLVSENTVSVDLETLETLVTLAETARTLGDNKNVMAFKKAVEKGKALLALQCETCASRDNCPGKGHMVEECPYYAKEA